MPQVGDDLPAVTQEIQLTVDDAVKASEIDGAHAVHLAQVEDGVAVISEFETYTRIVEITPDGAFVRTT